MEELQFDALYTIRPGHADVPLRCNLSVYTCLGPGGSRGPLGVKN